MASNLTSELIIRRVFDDVTGALKIISTDMSIELSADDGDSVIPQKATVQMAVTAGQIVDVTKYSRITYLHPVNANTGLKIMLNDNTTEITAPNLTTAVSTEICARSIKIMLAGEIVLKS